MSAPKLLLSVLTVSMFSLTLSACGSDGDKVKEEYDRIEDQVKDEYDRVEDKVKEKYKEVEDKLSDDENPWLRFWSRYFYQKNHSIISWINNPRRRSRRFICRTLY
ncbi:hypothetical protein [Psychrobacter sp. WY6]|uniref:hypothetical protein n=1 Tax=Psychrobacter sp. WY6 TaxID=2708350 RepID=UPI002022FF55|nr:hypothetical protein [Psychrobacter sp. WY6]